MPEAQDSSRRTASAPSTLVTPAVVLAVGESALAMTCHHPSRPLCVHLPPTSRPFGKTQASREAGLSEQVSHKQELRRQRAMHPPVLGGQIFRVCSAEVLLGGGPCRGRACCQPQRGPSSGRALPCLSGSPASSPADLLSLVSSQHTHTHTHTSQSQNSKTAQRCITDLQILDLPMTFHTSALPPVVLLPAPLRDCETTPPSPEQGKLALFSEYHP